MEAHPEPVEVYLEAVELHLGALEANPGTLKAHPGPVEAPPGAMVYEITLNYYGSNFAKLNPLSYKISTFAKFQKSLS